MCPLLFASFLSVALFLLCGSNQFYKWPGLICASCSNSYWAFYGRAAFQVFNPHSDSLSRSVIIPVYR